jgi:hypothetical protein
LLKPERNKLLRRIGIIILVVLFFIVAFGRDILKLMDLPAFCGICHNMRPSINSYLASNHEGVPCYMCHFEPGAINYIKSKVAFSIKDTFKYLMGKYDMKLKHKIKEASCLRKGCHHMKRAKHPVYYHKGVIFSHEPHIGIEGGCTSCHNADDKIHMSVKGNKECLKCHFIDEPEPDNETCQRCHKILKVTEDINHNQEPVISMKCFECHEGIHAQQ